jgi:hypothetical protein
LEYSWYCQRIESPNSDYIDCHCSILFSETLELMLRDLIRLGLLELEIVDITNTNFHEFYVHLTKSQPVQLSSEDFYFHRKQLLERIAMILGRSGFGFRKEMLRQEIIAELGPQAPVEKQTMKQIGAKLRRLLFRLHRLLNKRLGREVGY